MRRGDAAVGTSQFTDMPMGVCSLSCPESDADGDGRDPAHMPMVGPSRLHTARAHVCLVRVFAFAYYVASCLLGWAHGPRLARPTEGG